MFVAVEEKADAKSGRTLLGGRGLCLLSEADPECDSPMHTCHGREREWDRAFDDPLEVRRLGELQSREEAGGVGAFGAILVGCGSEPLPRAWGPNHWRG